MESEDISGCGAIICTHCVIRGLPILRATRDTPLREEDSGWQFTCGVHSHGTEDAQLWRVDEVLKHDQSVRAIIGAPVLSSFTKTRPDGPWKNEEYENGD